MKYGNTIFHVGGPRNVVGKLWSQNKERFEAWQEGQTGYPLIDANMMLITPPNSHHGWHMGASHRGLSMMR
jgi:deoxyribodipyrimidine photolyase